MRASSPPSSLPATPSRTPACRRCVPLAELAIGVPARLDSALLPACDVAFLEAIGLGHGCTLCVRGRGCAFIVDVDSTRLAVAGSVARRIMVSPLDGERSADP